LLLQLSYIAEIFLFLDVGMDALDIEKWKFASDRCVKYPNFRQSFELFLYILHS